VWSDQLAYDQQSRINTFAHVNYTEEEKSLAFCFALTEQAALSLGKKYIWHRLTAIIK
jgi:xylulokinase